MFLNFSFVCQNNLSVGLKLDRPRCTIGYCYIKVSILEGPKHILNRKGQSHKHLYILSRLWYRTEIFSVPKNLLTEIEKDILDFVWKKKKHEINKQLLMSCESDGGLQLVDIQSKIGARHLSWLAKVLKLP